MDEENDGFHLVGDLSPPEAKRFLEKLDAEGIPYEIEVDDSEVKNLLPWQARFGGTFGAGVRILVYVAEEHCLRAGKCHDELFV